ncbi:MAG TPA: right-handed parallel beta-helix repeat-containing protein [Planctomycetota bacterium]|nr:right-handed parallel beta-helix repeat-containing protein [Planctomycetota bacterium]
MRMLLPLVAIASIHAVDVADVAGLAAAMAAAEAGSVIRIAAGSYRGGIHRAGLHGTADAPVVICGADPAHPPELVGGADGLHIAGCAHLELRDLVLRGAATNGLNIDDGESGAHDVIIRRITVREVGPDGNRDGVKLSGVDRFLVEDCVIERWGTRGSGIDMVGCHDGVIAGTLFRHDPGHDDGNGVQTKGGSARIVVRACRFEDALSRAVQLGGTTGMGFFRPQPPGPAEGADLVVEDCVIEGSQAAIAFVNAERCLVRRNVIRRPGRWVMRILQETTGDGFVPCRDNEFSDNTVVWSAAGFEGTVNSGAGTAPESFLRAQPLVLRRSPRGQRADPAGGGDRWRGRRRSRRRRPLAPPLRRWAVPDEAPELLVEVLGVRQADGGGDRADRLIGGDQQLARALDAPRQQEARDGHAEALAEAPREMVLRHTDLARQPRHRHRLAQAFDHQRRDALDGGVGALARRRRHRHLERDAQQQLLQRR